MSSIIVFPRGVRLSENGLVKGPLPKRGDPFICPCFVGDDEGVVCRSGDGDAGDSGLRKGELRGELKPNGEGLYAGGIDYALLASD